MLPSSEGAHNHSSSSLSRVAERVARRRRVGCGSVGYNTGAMSGLVPSGSQRNDALPVVKQLAAQTQWHIRFYREGDEPAMLRVLQASFSVWPKVETSVPPTRPPSLEDGESPVGAALPSRGRDRQQDDRCASLHRPRGDVRRPNAARLPAGRHLSESGVSGPGHPQADPRAGLRAARGPERTRRRST